MDIDVSQPSLSQYWVYHPKIYYSSPILPSYNKLLKYYLMFQYLFIFSLIMAWHGDHLSSFSLRAQTCHGKVLHLNEVAEPSTCGCITGKEAAQEEPLQLQVVTLWRALWKAVVLDPGSHQLLGSFKTRLCLWVGNHSSGESRTQPGRRTTRLSVFPLGAPGRNIAGEETLCWLSWSVFLKNSSTDV